MSTIAERYAAYKANKTPDYRQIESMDGDEKARTIAKLKSEAVNIDWKHRLNTKTKATPKGAKSYLEYYYGKGNVVSLGGANDNYAVLRDGEPPMLVEDADKGFVEGVKEFGADILDFLPDLPEMAAQAYGAIKGGIAGAAAGSVVPGAGTVVGGVAGAVGGASLAAIPARSARLAASASLPGDDGLDAAGVVDDIANSALYAGVGEGVGGAVLPAAARGVRRAAKSVWARTAAKKRAAAEMASEVGHAGEHATTTARRAFSEAEEQGIDISATQATRSRASSEAEFLSREAHPAKWKKFDATQDAQVAAAGEKVFPRLTKKQISKMEALENAAYTKAMKEGGKRKVIRADDMSDVLKTFSERPGQEKAIKKAVKEMENGMTVGEFQGYVRSFGRKGGPFADMDAGDKSRLMAAAMNDLTQTIKSSSKSGAKKNAKLVSSLRKVRRGLGRRKLYQEKRDAIDDLFTAAQETTGESARAARRRGEAAVINPGKLSQSVLTGKSAKKIAKTLGEGSARHKALVAYAETLGIVSEGRALGKGTNPGKNLAEDMARPLPLMAAGHAIAPGTGEAAGAAAKPVGRFLRWLRTSENLTDALMDKEKTMLMLSYSKAFNAGKFKLAEKSATAFMTKVAQSDKSGDKER